ncbi:MAG: FAD-dependent monooxygenase [Candidatus Eremiobacteraeota bacterium]|nr:FAD-dependent monooxygenase [Candidatus Eremiobacteraeota bacterium]
MRGVRLVPSGAGPLELAFAARSLACERAVLDAHLLTAARDAGAVLLRAQAEDLAFESDRTSGVIVRDEHGERRTIPARFVVGADGSGSLVARKLGLMHAERGVRRFAVGGHYRGLGTLDHHVEMHVGSGAYVALNPLDDERANVMVVIRERELRSWSGAIDAGMSTLCSRLTRNERTLADAHRIGPRVSIGPLAFSVNGATHGGALLVGDAAGFLDPFTGQGVLLALRGARAAAEAIGHALARPAEERAAMARYGASRERDFRVRRRVGRLVDLLVDVPFLARRSSVRFRHRPELAATLLDALGGIIAPERALAPGFMARLLL